MATEVGPVITGVGKGLMTTVALPLILFVQEVVALEATTVYVPAAVCKPKLREAPVAAKGEPKGTPPLYN